MIQRGILGVSPDERPAKASAVSQRRQAHVLCMRCCGDNIDMRAVHARDSRRISNADVIDIKRGMYLHAWSEMDSLQHKMGKI